MFLILPLYAAARLAAECMYYIPLVSYILICNVNWIMYLLTCSRIITLADV